MLLTLFLVRLALAAAASPLEPSTPAVSTLSLSSKLFPSSSISVTPGSQVPTTVGTSLITGASALTTLASASKLPQASTLPPQSSMREVPAANHVVTPRVVSPPKALSPITRKPPPIARLIDWHSPKEPPLYGPDTIDLEYQQQAKKMRELKKLISQRNSERRDGNLLEELKKVLKENNDEYVENTRSDLNDLGQINMEYRRRYKKPRRLKVTTPSDKLEFWSGEAVTTSKAPDGRGGRRHSIHHSHSRISLAPWQLLTVSPPTMEAGMPPNQLNPDNKKIITFMNKNRDQLKAFSAHKKKQGRGGAGGRPGVWGGEGAPNRGGFEGRLHPGKHMEGRWPRPVQGEAWQKAARTRSQASLRELMGAVLHATSTYEPRQLDLAPARGTHVEDLRAKGRICQRNVMKPEGPKYDSHGNTYLPEFVNSPQRDYAVTKKKTLILPICCNCCKKSVLGCE